jgi:hypothetical protein
MEYSIAESANTGPGRPSETILMNVLTFKKLCLKNNTKKASEIHDYYTLPFQHFF